jgi:hypothetical protein
MTQPVRAPPGSRSLAEAARSLSRSSKGPAKFPVWAPRVSAVAWGRPVGGVLHA